MAQKNTWTIESGIMVVAVIVIVGGGAVAFYPSFKAMLDAWAMARSVTQQSNGSSCSTEGDNAKAVFCKPGAPPGGAPTHSAVDSPLGAVRRMDNALGRTSP